ncbi:hypothetical protein P7K49_000253, partial [Saguinus oedipus]
QRVARDLRLPRACGQGRAPRGATEPSAGSATGETQIRPLWRQTNRGERETRARRSRER